MIAVDLLRDRINDVISDMELQFGRVAPTLEELAREALRGDRNAYAEMQRLGRAGLAPLIDMYGNATGTLAAEWYDFNRDALKVSGSWSGSTLQSPSIDTGAIIGGSMKDFVTANSVVSGIEAGMGLRVHQAAQGTIMDSVLEDKSALGWGRVAAIGACPFCAMLAGRGATYRTRHTATFAPHSHCRCSALPLWKSDPTGESMRSREDTISTRRVLSDKQRASQNAQARQWIADNKATLGLLP